MSKAKTMSSANWTDAIIMARTNSRDFHVPRGLIYQIGNLKSLVMPGILCIVFQSEQDGKMRFHSTIETLCK